MPQTFQPAVIFYQQGKLTEAEKLCQKILSANPDHFDALHLSGMIKLQQGSYEESVTLITSALQRKPNSANALSNLGIGLKHLNRHSEALATYDRALAIKPDFTEVYYNRGNVLQALNRPQEALASYDKALAIKPNYVEALDNRGLTLQALNRHEEALESYDRAIAIKPHHEKALNNRGSALHALKRHAEALASYDKALAIKPNYFEALENRGSALHALKRHEDALASFDRALAIKPDDATTLNSRGLALQALHRPEEALTSIEKAIALKPDFADAHNNYGGALEEQGRSQEALESYRRAVAFDPNFVEAYNNLGVALTRQNRLDEAIESFHRALALKNDFADAHWNLALAQLAFGDYANGWREYEWRWRTENSPKKFTQALWAGEDLAGKTILLYAEQGLGDTIQFLRYAPLVASRGARVILEVAPSLVHLMAGAKGVAQVFASGAPLPDFDLCCPLLSLPLRFGTTLETIPAKVPYLSAEPTLIRRWHAAMGDEPGLKVGLVWAGSPQHKNDRNRSIALERLQPVLAVSGIRWFSLQVGERSDDISRLPAGSVTDLSSRLTDFTETAAVMANLDLVLTIDTSIAHLAGALGRRTWVMLPFVPDWRWLLERQDSPWYPSLRLFRQPAPGDWDSMLMDTRVALTQLATDRR